MANPVDPVCGMEIPPGQAAAQSQYDGRVFQFCSEECRKIFDEKPEDFVGGKFDKVTEPAAQ